MCYTFNSNILIKKRINKHCFLWSTKVCVYTVWLVYNSNKDVTSSQSVTAKTKPTASENLVGELRAFTVNVKNGLYGSV